MASSSPPAGGGNAVQPYRMHVSQRYLDLTAQKLALTRLPRDPQFFQGSADYGVAKSELEPLIDHWMEQYDWRAEETALNDALPQYRVSINGTRMHFVHKRSTSKRVTPLLFVHGWPESFVTVMKIIDALVDPITTPPKGHDDAMAFHVVAPSSPGFGFSDPLSEEGNHINMTADMLDALMKTLGYTSYMVHGSGWALRVCRAIALRRPQHVIAIHTTNPDVPPPRPGMGYNPDDIALDALSVHSPQSPGSYTPQGSPRSVSTRVEHPQTLAYALSDSPAGLLAHIYDHIRPPTPALAHTLPIRSPRGFGMSTISNPWTPSALITWTMMYWLPGPEVALRWLANSRELTGGLWTVYSNVPMGISYFQDSGSSPGSGDMSPVNPVTVAWAEAYHHVVMNRRREGRVRYPAWERPMETILDIRELAELVCGTGIVHYGDLTSPQA